MDESQCAPAQAPLPSFENLDDFTVNVNSLLIDTFASLPLSLRVPFFAKLKKEPNLFVQLPPRVRLSAYSRLMEKVEFQSERVKHPTQMDLSEAEESPSIQQMDTKHPPCLLGPNKVPSPFQNSIQLPTDFEPGRYSVLLGSKYKYCESLGNLHVQEVCRTFLKKYTQATKGGKTRVINEILQIISEACPVGAFVRIVENRYWEVNGRSARDKIRFIMHDMLKNMDTAKK
jgi:hypothetical protein